MDKIALEGIRIADFTWAWAGAYATTQLAFLGAEVIRIESNQRIDAARKRHSLSHKADLGINEGQNFHQLNPNKMSITLNLRKERAIELAKELVAKSDIVMDNFRPGVMDRLGLGYATLKEINPDIIVLSSSARGASGPEKLYSGFAPQQSAVGGIGHLIGYSDDTPTVLHGVPDLESAAITTFAILTALYYRSQTGKGQFIDLAQAELLTCLIGEAILDYDMNGRVRSRNGNYNGNAAPHNCYRCKGEDKWVSIAVTNEEEWQTFCKTIGSAGLSQDKRFNNADNRYQNREQLDKLIGEWTSKYTHYEVTKILQKAGIAAMPCFSAEELYKDPHLKERGLYVEMEHAETGKEVLLGPPWKLSETPAKVTSAAPLLGQHNQYVFGEILGMSDEEIEMLMREEVIY